MKTRGRGEVETVHKELKMNPNDRIKADPERVMTPDRPQTSMWSLSWRNVMSSFEHGLARKQSECPK